MALSIKNLTIEQRYLVKCLMQLSKTAFIVESNIVNRNHTLYCSVHEAIENILIGLESTGIDGNRSEIFSFVYKNINEMELL